MATTPSKLPMDDLNLSPQDSATNMSKEGDTDTTFDKNEGDIMEAIASLQLPRMPAPKQGVNPLPTLTILVCADIDLRSTSALAECLLMEPELRNQTMDLIIAAGPCTRDEDLVAYYQGTAQRNKYKRRQQQLRTTVYHPNQVSSSGSNTDPMGDQFCTNETTLLYRTREESAALEGLMTAALSQLESTVCRVVYCPGFSDPLTVVVDTKRLTPNSRNLHRQWIPLVPGLGCAGLFYLDGMEHIMTHYSATAAASYNDDDSDASDEDGENTAMLLADQLVKMQQSPSGYRASLSALLSLAPEADQQNPLFDGRGQSILVTHYVDGRKLVKSDLNDSVLDLDDTCGLDDLFHAADLTWSPNQNNRQNLNNEGSSSPPSCTDIPGPVDHIDFLLDPNTCRNLCLEIASGSATTLPAKWISGKLQQDRKSRMRGPLLLPGSLRERGEFSILNLSLVEQNEKSLERRRFAWEVQSVDFHHIRT